MGKAPPGSEANRQLYFSNKPHRTEKGLRPFVILSSKPSGWGLVIWVSSFRNQVWVPAPPWLTIVCNCSYRGSDAIFQSLWALHTWCRKPTHPQTNNHYGRSRRRCRLSSTPTEHVPTSLKLRVLVYCCLCSWHGQGAHSLSGNTGSTKSYAPVVVWIWKVPKRFMCWQLPAGGILRGD